jgi:hypothetical protein
MGNFIEVIMTRSVLLKNILMAAGYFLLPYLMAVAAEKLTESPKASRPLFFLCANFLMLTMGLAMWRQTYSWIAGFANFGFSSVFMLLCILQMIPLFRDEPVQKPSVLQAIIFFLIAIAGQLFLENLALFMVIATVTACIVHYKKYKCIPPTYVAMALGTLIGLVIMFSSSIYGSMLNTGEAIDGVRTLSFSFSDGFGKIIYNIFYQAMCLARRGGQFRCAAIIILTLLNITAARSGFKYKKLLFVFNGILILFYLIADLLPEEGALWILIGGGMGFALYGGIAVEVFFLFREQKQLCCKLLTLLGCAVTLILPFLAIGENGPRIFFPSYIFLVLFTIVLIDALVKLEKERTYLFRGALCAVAIVALILGWCYTGIGICSYQRQLLIKQAVAQQADTVILPKYPYETFLWKADSGEGRMPYFKEFYGIPEDMEVIFK